MKDKLNILLVEDSPDDALLIEQELKRGGLDAVCTRVDTQEALLDAINQQKWDFILSDFSLVTFNGLDVLSLLNQHGIEEPCILVSGAVGEETAVEAMKAGARDYIMKDKMLKLVPAITRELEHYKQQQEKKKLDEALQKSEETLKESEERFLQIADNIQEMFWLEDAADNSILYISPAFETIWGRSCDELLKDPETWMRTIFPDDRVFVRQVQSDDDENEKSVEYRIIRPDGEVRWVRSRLFPIFGDDGNVYRRAGIATDITESRNAAEREQYQQKQLIQADKMSSLGVLVSGIGHEINNPNNYILPNSRIVHKAWTDIAPALEHFYREQGDFSIAGLPYSEAYTEIEKMIQGIGKGAEHIKVIVQNLREFATPATGTVEKNIDLNRVAQDAILLTENLIKKTTDTFRTLFDEKIPYVEGNTQELEQVVVNLITNACHALQDDRKTIVISTEYDEANSTVTLKVVDKGRGIPHEDMTRIMDPFFTTKRDRGGTGLGLPISYKIVKSCGGDLRLESKEGEGTSATITLPALLG